MDLKTFVSETLTQIVSGISEAQRNIANLRTNAAVNPASVSSASSRQLTGARPVEFDVALTVVERSASTQEDSEARSSGMISVVRSSAENSSVATDHEATSQEAVSRVRFSVMLSQPGDVDVYQEPNFAELGRRLA
jgi:hypothetical protein